MHPTPRSLLRAFTLIELLTVIAVLGILSALVIPVVSQVRLSASKTQCAANLRQLGVGLRLHANDNKDLFPPVQAAAPSGQIGQVWFIAITPYLQNATTDSSRLIETYICPIRASTYTAASPSDWNRLGYGMSFRMIGSPTTGWPANALNSQARLSNIQTPSRTVLVGEEQGWNWGVHAANVDPYINPATGANRALRHGDSANYLLVDGSVKSIRATRDELLPYLAK